jgi:CTP:molybdopterin cytidylyltransferase MocA
MGLAKALLPLNGVPLVLCHVNALRPARVLVVTGASSDPITALLPTDIEVIHNPDWAQTWPADSLRLALQQADIRGPCLVCPVDTPPARPETLQALLSAGAPAVPVDSDGRPGHPVLLSEVEVAEMRRQAPEGGLRTLLTGVLRVAVCDPNVAMDFDHPSAWRRFLTRVTPPPPSG